MVWRNFPSYRLRYRIGQWRYRTGQRRYKRQHARLTREKGSLGFAGGDVAPLPRSEGPPAGAEPTTAGRVGDDSVRYQTYWVMETRGEWIVRHEDIQIASRPTRASAIGVAVLRAHRDPPSEVVILRSEGEIEEKCSFGD